MLGAVRTNIAVDGVWAVSTRAFTFDLWKGIFNLILRMSLGRAGQTLWAPLSLPRSTRVFHDLNNGSQRFVQPPNVTMSIRRTSYRGTTIYALTVARGSRW